MDNLDNKFIVYCWSFFIY